MLATRYIESGLGEPEQDANTALTELDKALRATKIGDQCEAIVRFPRLFEKYPFPILVNSSLLKLAEVFRVGNNILRLWILKVCEQTDKHLDKILNIDEFVRRIFIVYSSNDPVARGLALRTLGAVARIIPEKEQVHHAIRQSLDSHNSVEVDAAITAAMQFAAQSKTFAVSMCGKMSDMIEGQATPDNRKLQLIPILQYMHHDAKTAALVRTLCLNLLSKYPAEEFIITTLESLTQLSISTMVDVPAQVSLLLLYLKDPRTLVRSRTLQCLKDLAVKGAVKWPLEAIQAIVQAGMNRNISAREKSKILMVLLKLADSPVGCQVKITESDHLQTLLLDSLVHPNGETSCCALEVITCILGHYYKENKGAELKLQIVEYSIKNQLEVQLVTAKTENILVRILKCAVQLAALSENYSKYFTKFMFGMLNQTPGYSVAQCLLVTEALAAISANSRDDNPLLIYLSDIMKILEKNTNINYTNDKETQFIERLFTLILQISLITKLEMRHKEQMNKTLETVSLWSKYKIARCCARYGHHEMSFPLWKCLSEEVWSEHSHFWFDALYEMSLGESILQGAENVSNYLEGVNASTNRCIPDILNQSIIHYNRAVTAMTAASSTAIPMSFQIDYLKLRLEFLQTLLQVTLCCYLVYTPPAYISQSVAQVNKDELLRYGPIIVELRKCVTLLKKNEEAYINLYQKSFDADPATLDLLQLLRYRSNVLATSIERMCYTRDVHFEQLTTSYITNPERRSLLQHCNMIMDISDKFQASLVPGVAKMITPKNCASLLEQVALLCAAPFCMPRFFFQVLQSTSLKLNITPVPRVQGEPINHVPNTHLVVKVEGIVQYTLAAKSTFRTVAQIHLTLNSVLQTKLGANIDVKPSDASQFLSQTVKPNHDYFSGSFLLTLGNPGLWVANIEATIIDEDGKVWKNGCKGSLTIKVLDDSSKNTSGSVTNRR